MSTVLLVQEDPRLNDGWSLALESSGHTVLAAEATVEGIERIREGGVDVIVLDTREGEAELENFVAALNRLPDSPPFILVSASPDAPEISARLGAAAFVPKPCLSGELDRVVGRISPTPVSRMLDDEPTLPRIVTKR